MRRVLVLIGLILLGVTLTGAGKAKPRPAPVARPAPATEAAAASPIFAPTAVGAYATYHCITRVELGWGFVVSHTADVRAAIVGEETRDVDINAVVQTPEGGTEPARATGPADFIWVEFDVFTEGEKTVKLKALVAKNVLGNLPVTPVTDWSPYLQLPRGIETLIVQRGDETPKQLPLDKLHAADVPPWPFLAMALGTFMNLQVEEGAPDSVPVQAGKFDTRYFTIHANAWLPDVAKQKSGMEDADASAKIVAQVWASPDTPFGIVKATRSLDADFRAPKMNETRHVHLDGTVTLTGYGHDAKSLVTGTPEAVQ